MQHTITPLYSICITNSNSERTIKRAFSSILPLASRPEFEVVAVDNQSTDYSLEFLKELATKKFITRLEIEKCSRGKGRNIAFLLSRGKYLLCNIDMDVVYDSNEILNALVLYHKRFEGKVLSVNGMMVLPREVAAKLGGWKDLQRHEDNELALHAYELGFHAQNEKINVIKEHIKDEKESSIKRIKESYISFRDWFRIGLHFSDLPRNQRFHPSVIAGFISSRFHKRYSNRFFSEWWRLGWSGHEYGMADDTKSTENAV